MSQIPLNQLRLPAPRHVLMPLAGSQVSTTEIRRKIPNAARLRTFVLQPAFSGSWQLKRVKTWPYRGRFKTYPKVENQVTIVSYAVVSDNMVTLHSDIHPTVIRRSPSGMRFKEDSLGIYLQRVSDGMDYHPTALDWRSKNFATRVRKAMAWNYKKRVENARGVKRAEQEQEAQQQLEAIFQREMKTTMVTLADSRAAGNCVEGSLRFAELRLKLSREDVVSSSHLLHIHATHVLAAADVSNKAAAERAVRAAYRRETLISI